MLINRKTFIQTGTLASASVMLPGFLHALSRKPTVPPGNKVLVIVQFNGGNDGLNTIIPVTNDIYYRERPRLAIDKTKTLTLTDDAGLHPALVACKALYDEGNLAMLNTVGYPNPDRSHFRSMDIWQSGSQSNEYIYTGWLGRYLDAQCSGCDKPTQIIEMDDMLSLAMKGKNYSGIATTDPKRLYNSSNDPYYKQLIAGYQHGEETADYLYKTMGDAINSASYIHDKSQLQAAGKNYPATELGKNLRTIASLILSDINTKVYYVSLGSFDTHINQEAQQKRLFMQFNDAIKAFTDDMKAQHRFEDVLLMTFSEFGRRVGQNASNGTDHGTANNMFLISGALKQKGFLNPLPDLADLIDGDLKYTVDFKSVYATVLANWLGADDQKIIGKSYSKLKFI
jgi:uncharacterized protein (DUF1501 family)